MGNQPNARVYAAGAVMAILIIAAIAYAATRRSHGQLVATGASDVASSTATSTIPSITIDPTTGKVIAPPGYTVEEIPNGPVAPNHTKPLTFSADTSADVKQALEAQFQDDQTRLAKNATDYQAWINLGILRKMTGDYTGAETVWKYVSTIYPTDSVSTDDLGSLYLDYIKNYQKAEASYSASLARDPHDINAYQNLFALYTTYGYSGKMTSAQLVAQGLKANPNNAVLLQLQGRLHK